MIPNIVTGSDMGGLMRYLAGPGRANEHTHPHIVAGDPMAMDRWGGWEELSISQASDIAAHLDRYMNALNVHPVGTVRHFNRESGQIEVIPEMPNHVWHCSLSLSPEEGPLSENKWEAIAQAFMDEMGFTEASGKAPCRWVAVHHGSSKNGGDHIHIAANIVRADGTKWSPWRDQPRSQKACNMLEHRFGLRVIESREHARGARHDSAQALNETAARGADNTDRQILETRIRAAATTAMSEADFVERVRELGVRIRPRFAAGRTDVVLGYVVGLHTRKGEKTQWWAASKISRDLTLSRLRDRWEDTPQAANDAVQAWRAAWRGMPTPMQAAQQRFDNLTVRINALETYRQRLAHINPADPVALADATQDIAGLLSAAAAHVKPGTLEHQIFDFAARSVGRHAQLHRRTPAKNPSGDAVRLAALLIANSIAHPNSADSAATMLIMCVRTCQTLAELYRSAKQYNTAQDIIRDTQAVMTWAHREYSIAAHNIAYFDELNAQNTPTQQAVSTPTVDEPQPSSGDEDILAVTRSLIATMPGGPTHNNTPTPMRHEPPRPQQDPQKHTRGPKL